MNIRVVASVLVVCSFYIALPASAFTAVSTVTYFENDSPQDAISTYQISNAPAALDLFSSLSPSFTNPGYSFEGWNTSQNGQGVAFADGATYSFTSDLQLYAQWVLVPVAHTVTFFENDTISDLVSSFQVATSTEDLTSFSQLNPNFMNSGFEFEDWNTQANGGGQSYPDGAPYAFSADLRLYAIWIPIPIVTATFLLNGGSGSINSISVTEGEAVTLPSGNQILRLGFIFSGWSASKTGGLLLAPGSQIKLTSNATLYAIWLARNPLGLVAVIKFDGGNSVSLSERALSLISFLAKHLLGSREGNISVFGFDTGNASFGLDKVRSVRRAQVVAMALKQDLQQLSNRNFKIMARGEVSLPLAGTQFAEVFVT